MKKFILFMITLLTFCVAVAYGDDCDKRVNTVQLLLKQKYACVEKCGGWSVSSCVDGCSSVFDAPIIAVETLCLVSCTLAGKSLKYCTHLKKEASITLAEKPIRDKYMQDMRIKAQAAAAAKIKQIKEEQAKNGQNKYPTSNESSR